MLFDKVVSIFAMRRSFFIGHFIEKSDHHRKPILRGEKFAMVLDKGPVEPIPYFTPIPLGEVGHFTNVVGAGNIGLGREKTAVRELRHSVNIGDHNPIIGVNKKFHEPLVDGVRVDPAEEHEIPEHHESFNMVGIAVFE